MNIISDEDQYNSRAICEELDPQKSKSLGMFANNFTHLSHRLMTASNLKGMLFLYNNLNANFSYAASANVHNTVAVLADLFHPTLKNM